MFRAKLDYLNNQHLSLKQKNPKNPLFSLTHTLSLFLPNSQIQLCLCRSKFSSRLYYLNN